MPMSDTSAQAKALAEQIMTRTVAFADREEDVPEAAWKPHPKFAGVRLKLVVSGADTDGALSCHLVRVDPGCCLESHVHEGQWELHEVLAGQGEARVFGRGVDYFPGRAAVIPQGVEHEVKAGDQGLTLCAKFFPALA